MRVRHPNSTRWFDKVEDAQLRRLVYRAFALRGETGYEAALRAIEDWQVETLPDRLGRHVRKAAL